jgi:hypothetical protein
MNSLPFFAVSPKQGLEVLLSPILLPVPCTDHGRRSCSDCESSSWWSSTLEKNQQLMMMTWVSVKKLLLMTESMKTEPVMLMNKFLSLPRNQSCCGITCEGNLFWRCWLWRRELLSRATRVWHLIRENEIPLQDCSVLFNCESALHRFEVKRERERERVWRRHTSLIVLIGSWRFLPSSFLFFISKQEKKNIFLAWNPILLSRVLKEQVKLFFERRWGVEKR